MTLPLVIVSPEPHPQQGWKTFNLLSPCFQFLNIDRCPGKSANQEWSFGRCEPVREMSWEMLIASIQGIFLVYPAFFCHGREDTTGVKLHVSGSFTRMVVCNMSREMSKRTLVGPMGCEIWQGGRHG